MSEYREMLISLATMNQKEFAAFVRNLQSTSKETANHQLPKIQRKLFLVRNKK